jgi:hypothetical protein
MLTELFNNLALFLGIEASVFMNVITLLVVVLLILIGLSSGLEFKGILLVYGIAMAILQILGIESVFNIFTLIGDVLDEIAQSIFMAVI